MNLKIVLPYTFLFYILFVLSCSEPEKPVTKEEAVRVAASLAETIGRRNASLLNKLLDAEAFENRIHQQSQFKLNRSMVAGAMKGIRGGEFGHQIVTSLSKKGTYELVKRYEKDKHQHLVFRLYDDQLNYHDYELIKKGKEVKIADIFIYTTGENLSTTLAQSLQYMEESNAIDQVGKGELKKIELIKRHIKDNNYEKANKLFLQLPAVIRKQKLYKIIYIQIASGLETDQYLAALNQFQQEYPDAPNMYLLMIDAYFLKKDYPGALKCVNSLDSLINKDPFLDFYRALIYKESEDHTNKMVCLERLYQNLPRFGAGTLELINAYAEDKQWEKAVPLAKQYSKYKDADRETLESLYVLHPDFKEKMEGVGK